MMRATLDTNVVIAGLLWSGPPRRLLDAAIGGTVELFTSPLLANELYEALGYAKFARRLADQHTTIEAAVERYLAIATLTAAEPIAPAVLADPDDDHVIACAIAATPASSSPATSNCSPSRTTRTSRSLLPPSAWSG